MHPTPTHAAYLGVAFLFLSLLSTASVAGQHLTRTPNDVYQLAQILTQHVETLRKQHNINDGWPNPPLQKDKVPRQVLQKALEVLNKVSLLRQIKGMGAISIPPYPSRNITPNEVFELVKRLDAEIALLLPPGIHAGPHPQITVMTNKTPSDVYHKLWGISLALDPLLGVRGYTPTDVYVQTEKILQIIRFLRITQNLPNNTPQPPRPKGKHPNHALQAAYGLLDKIATAEKNLWIKPTQPPKLERRVITPTEVHDALSGVLSELERIKYRLGVERHFPEPRVKGEKSPDDVVRNLLWAKEMMPLFPIGAPLYQHDPASLSKTPDDVYLITEHVLDELIRYRALRGIHTPPRKPVKVSGLQPKHVYQKTLEGLKKINVLRHQMKMGEIALPQHPLRKITPTEVFDIAIRLDMEFQFLYDHADLDETAYVGAEKKVSVPQGKTPSDVYYNMWRISYLLDTIIGRKGHTTDDIYQETLSILEEIEIIARHLGRWKTRPSPKLIDGYGPKDVLLMTREVLQLINRIQDRAGIFEQRAPMPLPDENPTSNDIFNMVGLMQAELASLKLHLGIADQPTFPSATQGKSPSEVHHLLKQAHITLSYLLGDEAPTTEGEGP